MGYLRIPPMGVYVTPHGVLFMYTHTLDGFGKEYASQAGRYKVCFEYPALNKQSDFQIFVPEMANRRWHVQIDSETFKLM